MGSEWSEEQAGPQGPAGPQGEAGGSYLSSAVGTVGGLLYSGSAEAMLSGVVASGSVLGGFRYRLTVHLPVRSTVAGDVAIVRVRAGTTTAAALIGHQRVPLPVAGVDFHADFYVVYDHVAGDGPKTFGVSCARASGAGTVSVTVTPGSEPGWMELALLRTGGFVEF